jgi:hypothetical protein
VIGANYLPFTEAELLSFAETFETTARLVFTAQVRIAGEIDTRKMAAAHGASSTAALLRETLTISHPDARTRIDTAKATLPQPAVSGGTIDPVLPLLGAALADGEIGVEQTRTIVATMTKLPAAVNPQLREDVQETLVEQGILTQPKPFAKFARAVAEACDPDGKLDERPDPDKVELHIGTRNAMNHPGISGDCLKRSAQPAAGLCGERRRRPRVLPVGCHRSIRRAGDD